MTDFISTRCRFGADPWLGKDLITFFVIRVFLLACGVGPSTATPFSFSLFLILQRQNGSGHTWEVQYT